MAGTHPQMHEPSRPPEHGDSAPPGEPVVWQDHLAGYRELLPESTDLVLDALASMDRSIRELARELNCLGHFEDEDSGPKAA